MTDPLTPNYKKDVGRLATDRYDFEKHVNGTSFRHEADQIDLSPLVTIGGEEYSEVQSAIEALNAIVTPPTIPDATTGSKGIVRLAGDIGGIATNVVVTRIQGKPVSTLTPTDGDVLTWDSTTSTWSPSPSTNAFSAGGDLSGNNILQQVVGLTGNSGIVSSAANILNFILGANPLFTQTNATLNNAVDFILRAQSAKGNNHNGGNIILAGGQAGLGGLRGGVKLQMTTSVPNGYPGTLSPITLFNMFQVTEVAANRRVASLLNPNDLTIVDMPAGTGDMVMYIRNANTPPTSGNPSNGAILYGQNGEIWVKFQDGNQFSVGSIPNPSVWGSSGQQTYTNRSYSTTTNNTPVNAFTFALPDNTATRVDAILIGKKVGTNDSAQFNLSMGYVRNSASAPQPVGTLTNADSRTTAGATGWTLPTITTSGNTLQVKTGAATSTTINWLVVTQLAMSQG